MLKVSLLFRCFRGSQVPPKKKYRSSHSSSSSLRSFPFTNSPPQFYGQQQQQQPDSHQDQRHLESAIRSSKSIAADDAASATERPFCDHSFLHESLALLMRPPRPVRQTPYHTRPNGDNHRQWILQNMLACILTDTHMGSTNFKHSINMMTARG